jgi:hypothetical protein
MVRRAMSTRVDANSKLQLVRLDGTGGTLIRMRGTIDADLPTSELTRNIGPSFVVDLGGVERVTSFGVREWTRMLDRIQSGWVGFINCRPIVVAQFNMVANFGKQGQIVSLFLPYVCDACGEECEELVDLRDNFALVESSEPPTMKCPRCGQDAAFDDFPDTYFSYTRTQGRPRVPEGAARILSGKLDAPSNPFQAEKEIADDLTAVWFSGSLDGRARMKRVFDGLQGDVVIELSGLTDIDDDGVNKLLEQLKSQDCTPYLARVPSLAVSSLCSGALFRSLVSFMLEGACQKCGRAVATEVPAGEGRRSWTRICEHCISECRLVADVELAERAAQACAPSVPESVLRYLDTHPAGQRPGDKNRAAAAAAARHTRPAQSGYEVIKPLGKGGMAEVFLARKKGIEGFEKRVVLKRMQPELAARAEFAEMFLQEARTAARITHPNVVHIFDLGIDAGQYFIAMEYVEGWDLALIAGATRKLRKRIPIPVACRLVADLCAGLHAAHTARDESGQIAPIVHRDVSPHNILVSVEGTVKLTDFGISKSGDSGSKTRDGVVKGKVPYMAPEQLNAKVGVSDHRVDVYQAGVVFAELLVGYNAFNQQDDTQSVVSVLMNKLPDFETERPDCPPFVVELAKKALAPTPETRFQTARQLQVELENAIVTMLQSSLGADVVAAWLAELAAEAVPSGVLRPAGLTQTAGFEDVDLSDLNKTVAGLGSKA